MLIFKIKKLGSIYKLNKKQNYFKNINFKMEQISKIPIIPLNSPVSTLDCETVFKQLTPQEKLYAYYFTRASWYGSQICYFERSYESPALLYLLQKIFLQETPQAIREKLGTNGFNQEEIHQLFVYIAAFFTNCGNYKSFGDNKFVPELSGSRFKKFIVLSNAYEKYSEQFEQIWKNIEHELYSFTEPYACIEMSSNGGHSSYYSSNISQEEGEFLTKFLNSIGISPLNTRLIKHEDTFEVLIASVSKFKGDSEHLFEGKKIKITYGDFSEILQLVVDNLAICQVFAANQNQKQMLQYYIEHFYTGDMEAHKESQRWWIKDKGPVLETNIGFIECYLDPLKVRAEFEGFLSVVNKEQSKKLTTLVDNAEEFIKLLTWGAEFESEKFTSPDFTSLDVLTFASSGTPIGINIPNYDDIREHEGFKNVNLGNVYGKPNRSRILFATEEDKDLIMKYNDESLFVVVALHELLGHGTGKLFRKAETGELNFDPTLLNPLTGTPVTTYYNPNETYNGKFGEISSAFEECRADSVAIYLSCFPEVVNVLMPEFNSEEQLDIVYVEWYTILQSGLLSSEYYTPDKQKWGQAHMCASYVILQVMVRAGEGLVTIEKSQVDGKDTLLFRLDKSKIMTVGKKAIGDFIRKLQIYKSTADVVNGSAFFADYMKVDELNLEYRKICIENKSPRRLELQHDVQLVGKDQDVEYVKFEETYEGIIGSFITHYRGQVDHVYKNWERYQNHFRIKQ